MEKKHSTSSLVIFCIVIGLIIRMVLERRLSFLKHYPYFNTPLIDIRQLLESINNFKVSGHYFMDLNSIN